MHQRKSLLTGLSASLVGAALVASAAAGEQPKGRVVQPFNGKDLDGWKFKEPTGRSKWKVGVARLDRQNERALEFIDSIPENEQPQLVNVEARGVDIYTEQKFGDATITLELMVPRGSNSGVYVLGEYEVQVLDSYGKERVGPGDIGGLYGAAAPRVNAAKRPGEWQKLEIEFQAPRFDDEGRKVSNAVFKKVTLNDQVLHENVEMKGPTPTGVTGKEAPTGPLMFQGDHGPVAFRNIRVIVPDERRE